VSSYFNFDKNKQEKVQKMVSNIKDFSYIITDSEFEALVLECSLIKQYKPRYNILLKDDKGYNYIKITNEDWPKICQAKQLKKDGATYLGPYTSSNLVKQSIESARKIFKLPSCNKNFSKGQRARPCLNYYIKQCLAPCTGKIAHKT
jgi:excinuclease ABC subunit C